MERRASSPGLNRARGGANQSRDFSPGGANESSPALQGVNAYSGNRGLKAKEVIDRQSAALSAELARLKFEHGQWERRFALLKSDAIDPDLLEERARALLDYVDPYDMTLMYDTQAHQSAVPNP